MKKGLLLFVAAIAALSLTTACGKKDAPDNSTTETATTAPLAVEDAHKDVNMNKIEGEKLEDTEAEDTSLSAKGKIANCDVSIDDAKVIDYKDPITGEDIKVAVVSFRFKNNNSTPQSFDGFIALDATQDGVELRKVLVTGIEGINTNSGVENVDTNKSITVQKTYRLNDETSDLNILAYKYGELSGASISKAFKLN